MGKRLGDWVLVKPLAAGGMGELYLAARPSPRHGLQVAAIKQLLPHLCWDPELVRMFLGEVRIASGLQHPNIVRVLDWGTGTGGHYFVMEYVHGENAGHILRAFAERRPPLELGVGAVAELADGLHYAHEYQSPDGAVVGLVHRDVSPSNVMIGFDGSVKLLDFGIARITGRTQRTKTGGFKGKIGYMSPEQCTGGELDRRTDVFSLGILLYELTLGRRAFYANSDFAVVAKILEGDYVRPQTVDRYYPPALAAIVERALAPDPADRYGTAAELAGALRAYALHCQLDLNPHVRAHWMSSLFAARPWPSIDVDALGRNRSGAGSKRRVAVGVVAAAGLVVAGFVAGNRTRAQPRPGTDPAAVADDRPEAPRSLGGGAPVLPDPAVVGAVPDAIVSSAPTPTDAETSKPAHATAVDQAVIDGAVNDEAVNDEVRATHKSEPDHARRRPATARPGSGRPAARGMPALPAVGEPVAPPPSDSAAPVVGDEFLPPSWRG